MGSRKPAANSPKRRVKGKNSSIAGVDANSYSSESKHSVHGSLVQDYETEGGSPQKRARSSQKIAKIPLQLDSIVANKDEKEDEGYAQTDEESNVASEASTFAVRSQAHTLPIPFQGLPGSVLKGRNKGVFKNSIECVNCVTD